MSQVVRAAYYARVSTDDQTKGTSLDDQARICEAAIAARGWELVGKFVDEGRSGTDATRPEWSALLAGAKAGDYEAVVVAKLDRFSRKASDAVRETDRLDELGVALVVVKENLDMSTPAGRMMRTMLAGVAEFERDTIVSRTVAGQRAKARMGGWPGGQPPYGWRLEGHKRDAHAVPDEGEREVIAFVLRLVREGKPFADICDDLNSHGYLTRNGAIWSRDNIRKIFARDALWTGHITWGDTSASATTSGHGTRVTRDGKPKYGETITRQLPDPPLTEAEFLTIRRALTERGFSRSAQVVRRQMLTARLYGACGQPYGGVAYQHRASDGYRCTGNRYMSKGRRHERCGCREVQANKVDAIVWGEIEQLLGDADRLTRMAKDYLATKEDADPKASANEAKRVARELAKNEAALMRAEEKWLEASEADQPRYEKHVARYQAQVTQLRARQEQARAEEADRQVIRKQVTDLTELTKRAKNRLSNLTPDQRREVVELLNLRVTMGDIVSGGPAHVVIEGDLDSAAFSPAEDSRNTEGGAPACRPPCGPPIR